MVGLLSNLFSPAARAEQAYSPQPQVNISQILQQLVSHLAGAPSAPGGPAVPTLGYHPAPGQQVDTGYNPAQYQLATGNTAQAATDWEAHHPYAMAHNHVPSWLSHWLTSQIAPHVTHNNPMPVPAQPAQHPGLTVS